LGRSTASVANTGDQVGNLPVGVVALMLLTRVARSSRRDVPFDWAGQIAAVPAMGGLTLGVIEAGADGFSAPTASVAFVVASAGLVLFAVAQIRGRHPMVPREVLRSRTVLIASGTGFAFLAGLTGTVFVYSLYLQQQRGLSSFTTGLVFLPMTALSAFLGVPAAWMAEKFGPRVPVVGGLGLMGTSLTARPRGPARRRPTPDRPRPISRLGALAAATVAAGC
jgi:DHA2 family methylenomycin A resistance protein-like MFS transporter